MKLAGGIIEVFEIHYIAKLESAVFGTDSESSSLCTCILIPERKELAAN